MLIALTQLRPASAEEPEDVYDEALHDVRSIIMDSCEALADTGAFDFRISGFGASRWPVDVRTDLATVIEQLPKCLAACRNEEAFELDFFEQGIERTLEFAPVNASYDVRCLSRTAWKPNPKSETIEVGVLFTNRRFSTAC